MAKVPAGTLKNGVVGGRMYKGIMSCIVEGLEKHLSASVLGEINSNARKRKAEDAGSARTKRTAAPGLVQVIDLTDAD